MKLDGGGILRIEKNFVNVELPSDLPDDKPDNRILKVCMGLADTAKDSQVILVTKDIVLRLKAQILGMKAEDFERERVSDDDAQYTGRTEVYFPEDMIKEFKRRESLLMTLIRVMRTEIAVHLNFMKMNL